VIDFIIKLLLLKELIIKVVYNNILIINNTLIKYIYLILYKELLIVENLVYTIIRIVFI
jgi:hypothetical protein